MFHKKFDQKQLLDRYYDFVDKKTVEVLLQFDTFSELIDNNFGDNTVEKLNSVLFEKLDACFAEIPAKYFIRLRVVIKDFGEYTREYAERIIHDNIKLKISTHINSNRRKMINSLFLTLTGAAILVFSYFLAKLGVQQIFNDIINISGTLLVWESAYKILIERRENQYHTLQYAYKIADIILET